MKKFKIKDVEIFANSLHDALAIYKHKVKDEVYYEDIDSSSEAKKYAKKFGLEVEGRRAPWGGYEFAFEGSPQDLKKLVQELKKIGIEPTWSSVGDSKVKDFSPNQLQYCLDEMELAIDDIQKLSRKIVSYKNRYFELIKEAKSLASTDKEKQVQIAFWEKQFARAQSAYRASEGAL